MKLKIQQFSFCFFFGWLLFAACQNKEKKIELAVLHQWKAYPESRLQDFYKNFYQDRFGTGHAITDTQHVRNYLNYELSLMDGSLLPLIEPLGWKHQCVRVNLEMVRQGKISAEKLSELFILTASKLDTNAMYCWIKEWTNILEVIEKHELPIPHYLEDKAMIDSLLKKDPSVAVHHSAEFRNAYQPHYRVVKKDLIDNISK